MNRDDDVQMVAHFFCCRGGNKKHMYDYSGHAKKVQAFKPNVSILRTAMTHKQREVSPKLFWMLVFVAAAAAAIAAIVVIILKEPLKCYNCFKIDMDFIAAT